mgnify:FL=1|tara:strand:+ start:2965 stop:3882 length:918 start_codon:yes stop_codon:yes gene_type:complete
MLFIVAGSYSFAQQDKLITHFMYDKMSLNPGETGIDEGICGAMIYRNQWDKVNGAPNSMLLNIEANLTRFFPGGVGISMFHDQIGFNKQNNVVLNYSFPFTVSTIGTFGAGIGVGLTNFSMAPNWEPPTTAVDNTLPGSYSDNNLDLNFGIYLKGNADYYVGISSTHLSQSLLSSEGLNPTTYQMARHYYLMGGKTFENIFGSKGDIETNVLVRTDFVLTSADINARYMYHGAFNAYGGLTFRTFDAIAIMLGYEVIPSLTVGYSYDLTINRLSGISAGSHEIMAKYCYYLPMPPIQKSKHPRWL